MFDTTSRSSSVNANPRVLSHTSAASAHAASLRRAIGRSLCDFCKSDQYASVSL